jgi:hypothetical protein
VRRVLSWGLVGVLGIAVAALVVPAPAAAGSGHGWQVHCGDDAQGMGYGWFDSKGFNVSCRAVRRVANHYTFGKPGDRRFNGWRCDDDQVATEIWRVDCKRRRGDHEHVRFKFGA